MRTFAFALLIASSALLTPIAQSPALPLNEPHQEAPTTQCDLYAASAFDPQRKATGVPADKINPALAVPACESAVRQYPNSTRLIFQLGRAYQKDNNFTAALQQYRRAADQGHAVAQTNLGVMYENGQGVSRDYQQAAAWYRKLPNRDWRSAQHTLGSCTGMVKVSRTTISKPSLGIERLPNRDLRQSQFNVGNMYANG